MIIPESLDAVAAARMGERFIRPLYDDYGFVQIPQTVLRCLGASERGGVPFGARADLYRQYDAVILLLVDAFGWRFFERYAEQSPFLKRFVDQGMVAKLTSQFPSTTAAHITAIHTGLPVGQSGVFEWYYYEPQLDALIAPLLFSYAGDQRRNTLRGTADPATLYPSETLYAQLRQHEVDAHVFQHIAFAYSPYTEQVTRDAQTHAFRTLPEALVNVAELLERQQRRSYYYLYTENVDTLCHIYGPESPQVAAEIETLLFALEQTLHATLAQTDRRTLLLVTADHGQVAIDPATAIYLNREFPQVERWLKTTRSGKPLVPAGSSRDLFLYVKDEHLDEAQAFLAQALAGRAQVRRLDDLVAQGFFGSNSPSATFRGRVGNLVILPDAGESVWWYEKGRFEQNYRGSHGGLTREEMETVLMALPYGD